MAKRIVAENIAIIIADARENTFRYLPELATLQLGGSKDRVDILRKKMTRGGLALHYETMRRRALTAEQELLDLATRPDDGTLFCSQVENVVLAECTESNLRASQNGQLFGPAMLIDVYDKLKHISKAERSRVHSQSYDLLVGVAGLLTSECKIWWSKPFDLKDET